MKKANVLVIDDDPTMLELARFHLTDEGYGVVTASTGIDGLAAANNQAFDLVLTDLNLPDVDGIELVRRLKGATPDVEIIMVTGYGSVSKAVEATKAGAFFFVEKPVEFEELLILCAKAVERRQQAAEIRHLRERLSTRSSYFDIIGSSKPMQDIFETIDSVAESDANIMITGESGTGKELVANAIHFRSRRAKRPMMKVNCAALPKDLIESELFGHTRGAFTGATADKVGLIGQATGGSLFLDEIGEMPLELQPKLLRVLEERVYTSLGSTKPHEADFRLITATNRNPLDAVNARSLREDLYYRINTIEIFMPPLRERAEDVQGLAEHFLREFAAKYGRPAREISQRAYAYMFEYEWPGNVRELRNMIERAVLLTKGETLELEALQVGRITPRVPVMSAAATTAASGIEPAGKTATGNGHAGQETDVLAGLGREIVDSVHVRRDAESSTDVLTQIEGAIVAAALERTKGNKQAAAQLLGVYRPRLYHMIKKHELTTWI